jgi:hypothetical protein
VCAARSAFIWRTGDRQFRYELAAAVGSGVGLVGGRLVASISTCGVEEPQPVKTNTERNIARKGHSLCIVFPTEYTAKIWRVPHSTALLLE